MKRARQPQQRDISPAARTEMSRCRHCDKKFERETRRADERPIPDGERVKFCCTACRFEWNRQHEGGWNEEKAEAYMRRVMLPPDQYAALWDQRRDTSVDCRVPMSQRRGNGN